MQSNALLKMITYQLSVHYLLFVSYQYEISQRSIQQEAEPTLLESQLVKNINCVLMLAFYDVLIFMSVMSM